MLKKYLKNDKYNFLLILYTLILYIVTSNKSKINRYKNFTLLSMIFSVIIMYLNKYLGLGFLFLLYIHVMNGNRKETLKETFQETFKETFQENIDKIKDEKVRFIVENLLDNIDVYELRNISYNDFIKNDIILDIDDKYKEKVKYYKKLNEIYFFDIKRIVECINNDNNTISKVSKIDNLTFYERLGVDNYDRNFLEEDHLLLYELFFDNIVFDKDKLEHTSNIKNSKKIEIIDNIVLNNNYLNIKKSLYGLLILLNEYNLLSYKNDKLDIFETIKNISNSNIQDSYFDEYNIKLRANKYLEDTNFNKYKINNSNIYSQNTNELMNLFEDTQIVTTLNIRSKEDYTNYNNTKIKKEKKLDKNNYEIIVGEFSEKIIDVVNDLGKMIEEDIEVETEETMEETIETSNNEYISIKNFMHYLKKILIIFTKDNRILHVGILFLFISLMIYFIDTTK